MDSEALYSVVDDNEARLREVARTLWDTPEVALEETESARVLADTLESEGFDVEMGVGGLPTAFVARYGDDSPQIGLLGEYDALPGLSQIVTAERDPVREGGAGHGCGHNLHGVGALGGALAVKRAIDDGSLEGSIVYCGCPAEEILVGKPYMARAGVFDDLDAAMAWHPSDVSHVRLGSANALDSIEYVFEGEAAHAAASPESGRSALDALQLFTTGIEYAREHIPNESLVHYVITDGGDAPNVVPKRAAVKLFVRAPTRAGVADLSEWLDDIAAGAAQMTKTDVTPRFITGTHGYRPNETLGMAVWETMQRVGPIQYTDEERAFSQRLQGTISESALESRLSRYPEELQAHLRDHTLYGEPVKPFDRADHSAGTADLGEVCRIVPTVQFRAAAWPVGTPAHTWQAVAASGGVGFRGTVFAAKVFAGTAAELLTDPLLLEDVQSEHERLTDGQAYQPSVPADIDPTTES